MQTDTYESVTKKFEDLWEETCREEGIDKIKLDSFSKSVLDAVVQCRKKMGISQKELSQRMGVHSTVLSKLESGNTKITFPRLVDIAHALEVELQLHVYDCSTHEMIFTYYLTDSSSVNQTIGNIVATLRKKRGLLQKQLAEQADFEPTVISRLESGTIRPTFQRLQKICDVLQMKFEVELHKKEKKDN